jgi:hypothetical protein
MLSYIWLCGFIVLVLKMDTKSFYSNSKRPSRNRRPPPRYRELAPRNYMASTASELAPDDHITATASELAPNGDIGSTASELAPSDHIASTASELAPSDHIASTAIEFAPSDRISASAHNVLDNCMSASTELLDSDGIISTGIELGTNLIFASVEDLNSFFQFGSIQNDVSVVFMNSISGADCITLPVPTVSDSDTPILPISDDQISEVLSETQPLEHQAMSVEVEDIQGENAEINVNRGSRKRKRSTEGWKRNERKSKHLRGEAHVNSKGVDVVVKQALPINCNCRYKCSDTFDEASRNSLCAQYYALSDYSRQKDFILLNIVSRDVKTRQVKCQPDGNVNVSKIRMTSISYYFQLNGVRTRVCKNFFLKTLSISNRAVLTAIANRTEAGVFGGMDGRGRAPASNKTEEERMKEVHDHIKSFPKTESHHCRKDTKREYLDSRLTITKMYALYLEMLKNKHGELQKPVSEAVYRRTFVENYNLGFYHPKKDQCEECTKFELMSADEKENYKTNIEQHKERSQEAQAAKAFDKTRAKEQANFRSITFDLQSVLQVPCSDVSLMYYKRKLCCYNLTVYEQAPPNDAYCYLWSEVDGKRGSNEIGTCLFKYLTELPPEITEISMFSDTCGGQNRNQNVTAILLHAVRTIDHISVIEQKFLEKGHSYMECDSMHSAIERAKKNTAVFSISAWRAIFELSRNKHPYKVKQLQFNEFLDCKALCDETIKNRTKDVNGKVVNWLKIKVLRFDKSDCNAIQYKYRYGDPFVKINILGRGRRGLIPPLTTCYNAALPIPAVKKADLLSLCKSGVIPLEHQPFFKNLVAIKPGIPVEVDESDSC